MDLGSVFPPLPLSVLRDEIVGVELNRAPPLTVLVRANFSQGWIS